MSNIKTEEDKCPPGMALKDGKCIPSESVKTEEGNAGQSQNVGTATKDTANDTPNTNPKKCPEGTSWDGDKCAPTGAAAGSSGAADNPSVPGKEWFEKVMAQYAHYFSNITEQFKTSQQKQLEMLSSKLGIPKFNAEIASFGVKTESLSSGVDDSKTNAVYESTVAYPAKFFENAKKGLGGEGNGFISWSIKPEAFLSTLKKGWLNYGNNQAHGKVEDSKSEAFTISGGDMPQVFSKQVYLIPGGRMRVPIRQFLDTQIITDADRYNWYKVGGFDFDGTASEGTAETDESQTITKVTATPALKRASQTVNYSDIENAPFDLIEAFNRAAALGSLKAEAVEVLDTTYNAISPTNWVNGNTGGDITSDDVSGMTLKQEGIYHATKLIADQGGDTSPGNLVLFAHPKAVTELILDTAADFFTGTNPLNMTALGVLENRLGIDIVPTNNVHMQDNTTNDTWRNVLMTKGSIGLAVAADLQIEAQRRPDLSAVKVGARHRLKGAVIDETMTCRISTAQ